MNKKSLLSIILALAFIATLLCGCHDKSTIEKKESNKSTASEKELYNLGMDVVELMIEMVESDDYAELMGMTDHISTVREEVLYSDYSEPVKVYSITLPDIEKIIPKEGREQWDNLSDNLKEQVKIRFSGATIANIMNGAYGVDSLAFAATYQASKKTDEIDLEEPLYYLYTFEDAPSILVTFSGKNAYGYFLFLENAEDYSEVKKAFRAQKCTINKIK